MCGAINGKKREEKNSFLKSKINNSLQFQEFDLFKCMPFLDM